MGREVSGGEITKCGMNISFDIGPSYMSETVFETLPTRWERMRFIGLDAGWHFVRRICVVDAYEREREREREGRDDCYLPCIVTLRYCRDRAN